MSTNSQKWSRKCGPRGASALSGLFAAACVAGLLLGGCDNGSDNGGGSVIPPPGPPTGPLNWGSAVVLGSNVPSISAPAAAVTPAGVVSVAWTQTGLPLPGNMISADPYVGAREQAPGAAFTAVQLIEQPMAGDAVSDQIAELQGAGAGSGALFAWRRTTSTADRLAAARRESTGFVQMQLASLPLTSQADGLVIAANDAGAQAAAWVETIGAFPQVRFSRRSGAAAWSVPITLQTNAGVAGSDPAIAMDANGRAMVVWRQGSPAAQLWSRWVDADGTLGLALQLDNNQINDMRSPSVAAQDVNRFVATWEQAQAGGGVYDLKSTRWTGTTWLITPATIDTGVSSVFDSRVVPGAAQGATVAWRQDNFIYASRFSAANGNWGAPVQVNAGLAGTGQDPRLVADGSGNTILVWTQRPAGGVNDLYYAYLAVANGLFSAPVALEVDAGAVGSPALAVSGAGVGVVAWLQAVSGQTNPDLLARVLR